ncbi:hypothetical protein, partial [uncultured Bacteroides sp.]|uniref:hypothetical protein n=1 Tax=uncultured Bacteroides sp. TaxID=162156 RepID=UPI00280A8193
MNLEMASVVSYQIEVVWIFLKKNLQVSFYRFHRFTPFFSCQKPPKRLLLQDYALWPAGQIQFPPFS